MPKHSAITALLSRFVLVDIKLTMLSRLRARMDDSRRIRSVVLAAAAALVGIFS